MSDRDRLEAENRRLRAEALRAREDLEHTRERLAYALHQVAELRRRIPAGGVTQAAVPGSAPAEARDPVERLFEAIGRSRAMDRTKSMS